MDGRWQTAQGCGSERIVTQQRNKLLEPNTNDGTQGVSSMQGPPPSADLPSHHSNTEDAHGGRLWLQTYLAVVEQAG